MASATVVVRMASPQVCCAEDPVPVIDIKLATRVSTPVLKPPDESVILRRRAGSGQLKTDQPCKFYSSGAAAKASHTHALPCVSHTLATASENQSSFRTTRGPAVESVSSEDETLSAGAALD